jgi:hypothetical protein
LQFICEHPVHVAIRTDDRDEKGRLIRGGKRRVYAKFQRGGLPDYALRRALELFEFRAKPPEQTIEGWAAFYDSEADQIRMNWTDDERRLIEDELVRRGYVLVEKDKVPQPYPAYDAHRKVHGQRKIAHAVKEILAAVEAAGIDPDAVIAYELQEGGSPEVVEAMEALKNADGADVEQVVVA